MEKDINKIIIDEDTYNFRDDSIPDWAKEPNKPSYSASDVGALPIGTNIPVIQYIANESSMPETPTEGVLYLIGDELTLISFTINNTPYQAEEGMTWSEWCESEYNLQDNSFYTDSEGVYSIINGGYISGNDGGYKGANDIIINNYNYTIISYP